MQIAFLLPLGKNDICRLQNLEYEFMKNQADSFLLPLVYSFLEKNHSVTIITISCIDEFNVSNKNLTVINLRQLRHGNISALMHFRYETNRIYEKLKDIPCDIIHAHWCYEYAAAALKVSKKKTVITLHDWPDSIREYSDNFYWRTRLKFGRKNIKKAQYFVAVSPYVESLLMQAYPDKIVRLIPNFLPDEVFTGGDEEKHSWNYKFIAISNSTKRKNIECTLKAFCIIKEHYPSSTLQLYGEGLGENDSINKDANKRGLCNNVIFGGPISHDKIISKLKETDFLLHTSFEESFGMILIEAMAKGTIALAGNNTGGPPWVLNYGSAGILADITSPMDVAEKVVGCIRQEKCAILRKEAFVYARKNFSLSRVSKMTMQFYRDIVQRE